MERMNVHEQVNNVFWVGLGAGICFYALRLKFWGASGPESGFVPFLSGLLIGGTGLFLLASEGIKKSGKEKFWDSALARRRIFFVLLAFCAMTFLMPYLGFLLTSTLVLAFLLQVLEVRSWVKTILLAVVCSVAFYIFFDRLFGIHLPTGVIRF
jgi:hypothetical protein